jgi:predicted HicB family RNase H-like nuclease
VSVASGYPSQNLLNLFKLISMMQHKGYFGKVECDDEAQILHGEVLGIKDVVTFQADKANEIEKAFRDSVDDYLAFCKQRGEPPAISHSDF